MIQSFKNYGSQIFYSDLAGRLFGWNSGFLNFVDWRRVEFFVELVICFFKNICRDGKKGDDVWFLFRRMLVFLRFLLLNDVEWMNHLFVVI